MSGRTPFHLLVVLLFGLLSAFTTGCKKDDDVNATLDMLDKTTAELVDKVKKAEDPKKGVADAQAFLDSKREDLGKAMKDLGEVRGFQVGEETTARLGQSLFDNVTKVESLKLDLLQATMNDKDLDAALEKLCNDYSSLMTPSEG